MGAAHVWAVRHHNRNCVVQGDAVIAGSFPYSSATAAQSVSSAVAALVRCAAINARNWNVPGCIRDTAAVSTSLASASTDSSHNKQS